MNTRQKVVNFFLFQIGWFACVVNAANQMQFIAILSVVAILSVHIMMIGNVKKELMLIFAAGILGLIIESFNFQTGVLVVTSDSSVIKSAPLWIVCLWMLFASTLNISMKWLNSKYELAFALGAIAGPWAYYAGSQLGAIEFNVRHPWISALVIGVQWAIATPFLLWINQKISGVNQRPTQRTFV